MIAGIRWETATRRSRGTGFCSTGTSRWSPRTRAGCCTPSAGIRCRTSRSTPTSTRARCPRRVSLVSSTTVPRPMRARLRGRRARGMRRLEPRRRGTRMRATRMRGRHPRGPRMQGPQPQGPSGRGPRLREARLRAPRPDRRPSPGRKRRLRPGLSRASSTDPAIPGLVPAQRTARDHRRAPGGRERRGGPERREAGNAGRPGTGNAREAGNTHEKISPGGASIPGVTTAAQPGEQGAAYRRHHPAPARKPVSESRAQQAFISAVAPGALEAQHRYGVPAAVTIAQAIDESGWGQSELAARDHNLFGIKGTGPAGSVPLPTQEYVNGQPVSTSASFRAYHDVAESIDDHGRLLARSGYYQQAMGDRTHPDKFAAALTGVYATDPNYGANLISLMRRYDLYRYGVSGHGQPGAASRGAEPGSARIPGVPAAPPAPAQPAASASPSPPPTPAAPPVRARGRRPRLRQIRRARGRRPRLRHIRRARGRRPRLRHIRRARGRRPRLRHIRRARGRRPRLRHIRPARGPRPRLRHIRPARSRAAPCQRPRPARSRAARPPRTRPAPGRAPRPAPSPPSPVSPSSPRRRTG